MQTEEVKDWLGRIYYIDDAIKSIEVCISQCENDRKRISRILKNKKADELIHQSESLQSLFESQMSALICTKCEITETIEKLDDIELKTLLRYRYIACYTIEKTAEAMGYCPRTIKSKQNKAIKKIEKFAPFCLVLPHDK